jgi:hypothetical protein
MVAICMMSSVNGAPTFSNLYNVNDSRSLMRILLPPSFNDVLRRSTWFRAHQSDNWCMPVQFGIVCDTCRRLYLISRDRKSAHVQYDRRRGEFKLACPQPCRAVSYFSRGMLMASIVPAEPLVAATSKLINANQYPRTDEFSSQIFRHFPSENIRTNPSCCFDFVKSRRAVRISRAEPKRWRQHPICEHREISI